ncbi:MAG: hypothetical protein ACI9OE_001453 [Mariniflexile sp.]|jgi:hypothetical protein
MKSIVSIVLVLFFTNAFSQNLGFGGDGIRGMIITPNNDIKGDDYIYKEWNKGLLVLNDSVFSKQDYLKYDAYKDRVLIKYAVKMDEIIEINDGGLTGFSIIENDGYLKHDFIKLKASSFFDRSQNGFYEIVFNVEKTNYFIKKNTKLVFDPNRSKGSQTANNFPLEFQDKTTYFLKDAKGLYNEVRLKEKDIMPVLTGHNEALALYVKVNKIRFKNEEDVMKLVNYYYSL